MYGTWKAICYSRIGVRLGNAPVLRGTLFCKYCNLNVGTCSKFSGGANIKVIINLISVLRRVSLMLALNSSLLNKE
jgi:hypothetical protein